MDAGARGVPRRFVYAVKLLAAGIRLLVCTYNNCTVENKYALVEWVDEVSFSVVPCLKISVWEQWEK